MKKQFCITAALSILFFQACNPAVSQQKPHLDTPLTHVSNGMRLLKIEKIDAAFREFTRAKNLDPEFSEAYVGIGLVNGLKGDFESGLKAMEKADEYAQTDKQKAAVSIGYMRFYIIGGKQFTPNWLGYVKEAFHRAKQTAPDLSDPHFFLGMAYKKSKQFEKATEQFEKVVEMGKAYMEEAQAENETIRKKPGAKTESKPGN